MHHSALIALAKRSIRPVLLKVQSFNLYGQFVKRILHRGISYRKIIPSDAERLLRFYNYKLFSDSENPVALAESHIKEVSLSVHWFIAVKKDAIIGIVTVRRDTRNGSNPSSYILSGMSIKILHRRLGVAETLCRMAIKKVMEEGAGEVWLTVSEDTEAAVALYRKLGFRTVSNPKPEGGKKQINMIKYL